MNAPQGAAWREQLMFNAALWELMAKAKGLPAPWTLELFDGAKRPWSALYSRMRSTRITVMPIGFL